MFEGAWGVEVYNHGCANQAGLPDSEGVYDEILRGGKKIFALATDDNHSWPELKAWNTDCFGGYIWVKAPRLTYADVIDALVAGDFYASSGPEIHELYYDDETECVHIETSPAQEICMNTLGRLGLRIASPTGELITSADFKIDKERFGLVRFRVVGPTGKKAWTNPYYVDEFIPDAPAHRVII